MNGSRTFLPRKMMRTMKSGKPHREKNFLDGAFSPNHVSRARGRPGNVGPVSTERGMPSVGPYAGPRGPGGSSVAIGRPIYHASDGGSHAPRRQTPENQPPTRPSKERRGPARAGPSPGGPGASGGGGAPRA